MTDSEKTQNAASLLPEFAPGEITDEMSDCAHLIIKSEQPIADHRDQLAGRLARAHLSGLTTAPKAKFIVQAIRNVCYS